MANIQKSFTIPEEDARYVDWLIDTGKFAGVSDIVRAAIRVLQEQRKEKDIEFYKEVK
jgi:putative addiction module CopG family antidote